MQTFKAGGRAWELTITVASARRVRSLVGVDILAESLLTLLGRLVGDPILFVDVLYVLVKPQADAAGISDEAFGEMLAGAEIEQATDAFLEALVAFFPPRRQELMRKALAAMQRIVKEAEETMMAQAEASLETVEKTMRKAAEDALSPSPGTSSRSSPEPAASTPTR